MELLEKETCKISVSSVLDRNGKEYGKQFLLDGEEDTCWNSDQVIRAFAKIRQRESFQLTVLGNSTVHQNITERKEELYKNDAESAISRRILWKRI